MRLNTLHHQILKYCYQGLIGKIYRSEEGKMDNDFDKQKKSIAEAIQNLKRLNKALGRHLEDSITFNEINNTFSYRPEKRYESSEKEKK